MKNLFSIVVCCLILTGTIFGTEAGIASQAGITIRFYDRSIYYPGNSPSEPVLVNITISNNSAETLRFKLADERSFSIDFAAVTTRNQNLEHTEKWLRLRNTNNTVYFREISIEPGEAYSFVENVKDYLNIANPGLYILDCSFYPELKRLSGTSEASIKSNRLTLEVKPAPGAAATRLLPVSPVHAEVLQPQPMPPDQVLKYVLTARQHENWAQFFLYLDLEQMLSKDPARRKRYKAESEAGRFTMQENYKSELMQTKIDKDISSKPVEYKIEKTAYTETDGSVTVLEWFEYKGFREKKRFTYYVANHDGIWRIVDYTVDNLGSE